MSTISEIETFYLQWEEPQRGCLLAMRRIVLEQGDEIAETRKYGMPCFCIRGKGFCYLWVDKVTHHPYLLMVEGNKLDHPALEQGTRKRMKTLTCDPNLDLPIALINTILQQALALYEGG